MQQTLSLVHPVIYHGSGMTCVLSSPHPVYPFIFCVSGQRPWEVIWSGEPQNEYLPKASRAFSPQLRQVNFLTNIIRIEMDHSSLDYYYELDAVCLEGIPRPGKPPCYTGLQKNMHSLSP